MSQSEAGTVKTNDDSICIKSGRDADGWTESRPSHDILIEDCTVLSGFGVTIGSKVSGGIHDVTVNDLQDKPEGLDVSVLPIGSVSGLPVAPHPYG